MTKILNTYILPDTYVVFDLETTGFTPQSAEIIEIGALRITNGKIAEQFHSYVHPYMGIPERITSLTGITTSDVKDAPCIDGAIRSFWDFIKDDTLVAHNASFDCRFIDTFGAANGVAFSNSVIDSLRLARKHLSCGSHKLSAIKEYFGIERASHNALDDCYVTYKLTEYCRDAERALTH